MSAFGAMGRLELVVAGLAIALLVGCVGFAGSWGYEAFNCTERERSAAKEIPQLTARQHQPTSFEVGWCSIRYQSNATPEEALAHYRQQFGEKGWEIAKDGSTPNDGTSLVIDATKGGYEYKVQISGFAGEAAGDKAGVLIIVHK